MTPKLHRSIIPLFLCVLCASVVLTHAQTALERFQQFDKNGDGKLTREEFPAAKIFDGTDADKDGFLTREEIAAYFRKQQSGTTTTPTTPPAPAPSKPAASPVASVEIVETLNVPYATIAGVEPNLLSLDIHAPKDAKGLPVVVGFHGPLTKSASSLAARYFASTFLPNSGGMFNLAITTNEGIVHASTHAKNFT